MPKAAFVLLFACAAFAAGCGGANRDAMEKRVANLQDEVTRLQNTNDRLGERVQALEITSMHPRAPTAAAAPAAEAEESRVARPALKVVKLGPGQSAPSAEPVAEPEPEPAEEESGPRPVIKDHGARTPAWMKKPTPRAGTAPMGQNAGARRSAPQGT